MKFLFRISLLAMILSVSSCSSLNPLHYHVPKHFVQDFVQDLEHRLPVGVDVWQVYVLQKDLPNVMEHCSLMNGLPNCIRQVNQPTQTHQAMTEELMLALRDAFEKTRILDNQPTQPKLTIRANFRELLSSDGWFHSYAKARLHYQFLYQNKVIYETEITSNKILIELDLFFQSSREHKATNQAVQKNLMKLLNHLKHHSTIFQSTPKYSEFN